MDYQMFEQFAEVIADMVVKKLRENNAATEDTDYTPYDKMDRREQREIVEQINSIKEVAATDHTYERAKERGIPRSVISKLKYCTKDNIIGLQNNGRLRVGVCYKKQVAVFIVCIERGVLTVITSWLTNIVDYDKYEICDLF